MEKLQEIIPDPAVDAYMKVSNEILNLFFKHC